MDSWYEYILKDFMNSISKLTLVADPDQILSDPNILTGIHELGFDIIHFKDHISFRYEYEMNYRQALWDKGEDTDLVIILNSDKLDNLPYDLFSIGRRLSYKLSNIFPKLSNPVIRDIEKSDIDRLFRCYKRYSGEVLSDNETIEFLLKYIYFFDLNIYTTPKDIIKWLFLRHFDTSKNKRSIKPTEKVEKYVIERLSVNPLFSEWPLSSIIPSKADFFDFLQNQWEIFLNEKSSPLIPFDYDDIRVYVDNFFLEGYLQPIESTNPNNRSDWVKVGIAGSQNISTTNRTEHIIMSITDNHPSVNSSVDEWLEFSKIWAELRVLISKSSNLYSEDIMELYNKIENEFEEWLLQKYVLIHNLSYLPLPRMVHHIASYLASKKFPKGKIALIVMDGMSLDNWLVIKNKVYEKDKTLIFDEAKVFAWIPTITSISRQSIFAGTLPISFSTKLNTTSGENSLWKNFWLERGLTDQMIGYKKLLSNSLFKDLITTLDKPKLKVLGIVISKIDEIMHGIRVGTKGMYSNLNIWVQEGELYRLISELLNRNFQVFITSDHGNTEARGIGKPRQGILVDEKYKRARIYGGDGGESFREEAFKDFPESIKWPVGIGLPKDKYALIPKAGLAYCDERKTVITHGGLTIEEVIVPFVEIRRRVE